MALSAARPEASLLLALCGLSACSAPSLPDTPDTTAVVVDVPPADRVAAPDVPARMDAPAPMDATRDAAADHGLDARLLDAGGDALTDLARIDLALDAHTDIANDLAPDVLHDTPDVAVDASTVCPADMVRLPGVCMDRYEAPNVPGAAPLAMQSALSGAAWCSAHGKRLCTEAEWLRACQGSTRRPYPYGTTYVRGRCTDDRVWRSPNWTVLGAWPSAAAMAEATRLYQADPSGMRAGCVSEDGVQDLTGNVAEWVVRSFPNANNYDHVMKGCYWAGCYGGSNPSCAFVNPAHPSGFRTYEAGFRCCISMP